MFSTAWAPSIPPAPAQMQHPEEKAGRVKLKQAVPTFAPHKGRVAGRQIVRDAVPVP